MLLFIQWSALQRFIVGTCDSNTVKHDYNNLHITITNPKLLQYSQYAQANQAMYLFMCVYLLVAKLAK